MSQEYKVIQLSQDKAKEWNGPNGVIFYKKAKLEGHEKPVEIGKKTKDGLKVGDTIYGHIEATDYVTDKFKSDSRPQAQASSQAPKQTDEYWADKDAGIKAQFAIKAAIAYTAVVYNKDDAEKLDTEGNIERLAKDFFAMVDRVKLGEQDMEDRNDIGDGVLDKDDVDVINLDDIPF